jgi:dihydrofolate reductase
MSFSIIVAMDENRGIGKNNQLLVYLPNDLKWFKQHTIGHTVIMGRKTFESLPNGPLPKRRNIVFSRKIKDIPGVIVVNSLEQLMQIIDNEEENFVIGGAQIFKLFLPITDKLYITKIHHVFDADTFFPEIDWKQWRLVEKYENQPDSRHAFPYTFLIYEKQN